MLSSPGRYVGLLLLGATMALPLRSEETPPAKPPAAKKPNAPEKKAAPAADSKKAVELKKMDLSSLPADAVIVICEHANEAIDLVPQAVILNPRKYQEMREEIERLRKQLQTDKPAAPTKCLLKGKVEAGAVRLEAEFAGTAERADWLVALACPQAGASLAETDGRMALIRRAESGDFLVRIEKPGEYHVKLNLTLPVTGRESNSRGFELTLPRAVITQLDLELPANIKDVRVGGRSLDEPQLRGLKWDNRHLSGNPGLGPVDRLNLSWKEIRGSAGDPVRTAEGRIQVRVDAVGQMTEAELVLKPEGAPTAEWRLLVPLKAEIKVLPPGDARVKEIKAMSPDAAGVKAPFASLRTIHLKEPSAEPLHVQVRVPQTPRSSPVTPVGPFFVLDAVRQTGTVVVRNPVRNLHLDYHGHGDMQLRSRQTEEDRSDTPAAVATFEYSNIPLTANPKEASGPNSLSWLDLEAHTVHPQVRTRVTHTLKLCPSPRPASGARREKEGEDSRDAIAAERYWQIVTTITSATGKWMDLDQLKVYVPPEWTASDESFAVTPPSPPQREGGQPGRRHVVIPSSLLRETPAQSVQLEGRFAGSYKTEGRTVLNLPRPEGIVERCEVKIEAPADAEVIVNNAEQANLELSKPPRPSEQTWRSRSVPAEGLRIDVSWRPYRPELRVFSVVDLALSSNRADITHEIRLQLPAAPPPALQLRVPPALRESLRVEGDNAEDLQKLAVGPDGIARLAIATKAGGSDWRKVLHYTSRFAESNRPPGRTPFAVPLVVPEQATAGDVRVRIWSEPGLIPRPAADPHWEESSIEEVKQHRDLPVLVLHATKLDAPLRLVLGEQATGFSALVERALVRVQLLESGEQRWRAGFQLRRLAGRDLDVLLPGPVATLNAQFLLNRRSVTPDIVNDRGERTDGGSIARLHLFPELIRQSALLEVVFQSPPGRSSRSPLHTLLQPPQILGAPAVPTRWQVSVPGNRVLIAPESASGVERIWGLRGWLLAAHLQRTSADLELEREFDRAQPDSDSTATLAAETSPALVCWQDHTAAIVLTHAPQQAWLLVCSLGVLILGLGLYWAARPSPGEGRMAVWFWPLLALLTFSIALAALFWPATLSAVVYGCEPGLLVLLAVIGLQWLMHERYRRQIVFLPSFSRGRPGSSLVRKTASSRAKSGEPSTVDAPPPSME